MRTYANVHVVVKSLSLKEAVVRAAISDGGRAIDCFYNSGLAANYFAEGER